MGPSYLIDTNVLIYYFNDQIPAQAIPVMDEIVSQSFNVSIVTKIEFLGWAGYTESQYQEALKILGMATVFPLDEQVAEQAVVLRRQKKIKLGDAVIAGTCLQHGLTLVTRNMVDFAGISGLSLTIHLPDWQGLESRFCCGDGMWRRWGRIWGMR